MKEIRRFRMDREKSQARKTGAIDKGEMTWPKNEDWDGD